MEYERSMRNILNNSSYGYQPVVADSYFCLYKHENCKTIFCGLDEVGINDIQICCKSNISTFL